MPARSLLAAALTASTLAAPALARADALTGGTSPDGHAPTPAASPPSQPTVPGSRAKLVRGIAHAPAGAPLRVKRAIWSTNRIVGRPYRFGGGHQRWNDTGYDCSGAVSYALHGGGLLDSPMPSGGFMRWEKRGYGKWITVFAHGGHMYAVIAGLRLDTSSAGEPVSSGEGPRWRSNQRGGEGFTARHPAGF